MQRLVSLFIIGLLMVPGIGYSQNEEHENKEGKFKVTVPAGWKVRVDGSTSDLLAPPDAQLDEWSEYLGISVNQTEGAKLADTFNYYITEDFPGYYSEFKVIRKGEEAINGVKTLWVLFAFSNSTQLQGGKTKSAKLNNLFYFVEKNGMFYYLNGIAEESHFKDYESAFLEIVRSFKPGGM